VYIKPVGKGRGNRLAKGGCRVEKIPYTCPKIIESEQKKLGSYRIIYIDYKKNIAHWSILHPNRKSTVLNSYTLSKIAIAYIHRLVFTKGQ
jgi:hypothetical protein